MGREQGPPNPSVRLLDLQARRLQRARPHDRCAYLLQFKTRDGKYCYPLTVTDHYSRMLLLCKGLHSVRTEGAKPAFKRLFREHGVPDAIRTDNGAPFASTGSTGFASSMSGG